MLPPCFGEPLMHPENTDALPAIHEFGEALAVITDFKLELSGCNADPQRDA